jgi:crotonobetainyl-CoA:carnitine CoA-transferase CaiB-like acyl-CoA transferase
LASEHAATNTAMRDVAWGERTLRVPNCPVRFGAGPTQLDMPSALTGPPDIGAHNAEVRELWGLPSAP